MSGDRLGGNDADWLLAQLAAGGQPRPQQPVAPPPSAPSAPTGHSAASGHAGPADRSTPNTSGHEQGSGPADSAPTPRRNDEVLDWFSLAEAPVRDTGTRALPVIGETRSAPSATPGSEPSYSGQPYQGQYFQGQPAQGQPAQGQSFQTPPFQTPPFQTPPFQAQPAQPYQAQRPAAPTAPASPSHPQALPIVPPAPAASPSWEASAAATSAAATPQAPRPWAPAAPVTPTAPAAQGSPYPAWNQQAPSAAPAPSWSPSPNAPLTVEPPVGRPRTFDDVPSVPSSAPPHDQVAPGPATPTGQFALTWGEPDGGSISSEDALREAFRRLSQPDAAPEASAAPVAPAPAQPVAPRAPEPHAAPTFEPSPLVDPTADAAADASPFAGFAPPTVARSSFAPVTPAPAAPTSDFGADLWSALQEPESAPTPAPPAPVASMPAASAQPELTRRERLALEQREAEAAEAAAAEAAAADVAAAVAAAEAAAAAAAEAEAARAATFQPRAFPPAAPTESPSFRERPLDGAPRVTGLDRADEAPHVGSNQSFDEPSAPFAAPRTPFPAFAASPQAFAPAPPQHVEPVDDLLAALGGAAFAAGASAAAPSVPAPVADEPFAPAPDRGRFAAFAADAEPVALARPAEAEPNPDDADGLAGLGLAFDDGGLDDQPADDRPRVPQFGTARAWSAMPADESADAPAEPDAEAEEAGYRWDIKPDPTAPDPRADEPAGSPLRALAFGPQAAALAAGGAGAASAAALGTETRLLAPVAPIEQAPEADDPFGEADASDWFTGPAADEPPAATAMLQVVPDRGQVPTEAFADDHFAFGDDRESHGDPFAGTQPATQRLPHADSWTAVPHAGDDEPDDDDPFASLFAPTGPVRVATGATTGAAGGLGAPAMAGAWAGGNAAFASASSGSAGGAGLGGTGRAGGNTGFGASGAGAGGSGPSAGNGGRTGGGSGSRGGSGGSGGGSASGGSGSGRGQGGGSDGRKPAKPLIWIAGGLLVLVVLAGLFVFGTKLVGGGLAATSGPSASSGEGDAASDTPSPEPTAPQPMGVHAWNTLFGGECIDPFTSAWDEEYTVVDCGVAHAAQLVYRGTLPGDEAAAFPGEAELGAQMNTLCTAAGIVDVAAASGISDLQVQGSYPVTEEQWAAGERTYYCFANRAGGEPITGSIAGPGPSA